MDGYQFFQKDRRERRGRGVLLYVKEKIQCMEVSYGDLKTLSNVSGSR